jgi:NitT/TauT family transport system substrate-binding protein
MLRVQLDWMQGGGISVADLGVSGRGHRIGAAAAAIGLAVLAASCAGNSGHANGPEKTTIVVGAVPAVDTAGLYIAQQRGYFAAEGLRVKIEPIVSSELAISRQHAGIYDITFGGYVSYIQADAGRDLDLRIIAEGSLMGPGEQGLLTMPGSRITTLTGLRGTTVALNVVDNVGTILVGSALKSVGLSPSAVKFVQIPFPDMAAALKRHRVDVAWLPEPFASSTEEQLGAQDISDLDFGAVTGFPLVGYAATRAWEQRYPRTEAAFLRALEKGQEVADTDRAAVEQAMEKFLGVPPQVAAVMALPQYILAGVDRARMQRIVDAMQRFGMLKQRFDVSQIIG